MADDWRKQREIQAHGEAERAARDQQRDDSEGAASHWVWWTRNRDGIPTVSWWDAIGAVGQYVLKMLVWLIIILISCVVVVLIASVFRDSIERIDIALIAWIGVAAIVAAFPVGCLLGLRERKKMAARRSR